ncbi:MAG: OmpA family protein [Candidatus Marinimicrobia bacterium]|nr:OmpA family protein [Candidatus Neomarinimicrobiota bacterium]
MTQTTSTPQRKLAAIMFTDIAGFTALSAKDEEAALKLLDEQRSLLKPIVERYKGQWLKEIGDGLLLCFPSTKLSLECAIEIQQIARKIDDLNLRIGIHQGDILEKDGDIFGDDVNIASRIEPFAAIGGIAISDKVHRDISGSPEIATKFIGQPKLQGVAQDVKVYCITSHGLPETKLSEVSAKLENKLNNKKLIIPIVIILITFMYIFFPSEHPGTSIGILHMENLGSDEDALWARAFTEDLIIDVASLGILEVTPMIEVLRLAKSKLTFNEITQALDVKYILTSSIRKLENKFELKCQLIETQSKKSVFAKEWSESNEDAVKVTASLATNLLNVMGVNIDKNKASINIYELARTYYDAGDYENAILTLTPVYDLSEIDRSVHLEIPSGILFEEGLSSPIMNESNTTFLRKLKEVTQKKNVAKSYITVECHTDNQPITPSSEFKDNFELSSKRAEEVMKVFIKLGVPEEKIRAVGYAEMLPRNYSELETPSPEVTRECNSTPEMREKNNRVEIVVGGLK